MNKDEPGMSEENRYRLPLYGCRSDVWDRLQHDPTFVALVNTLEHLLYSAHTTPSELREALIVATTRREYRTMRPILVDPGEWCLEESVLKALGKKKESS